MTAQVFEMVALPNLHRHDQPGYYSLADLPQKPSVSHIAQSTGWWELDQIWKLYHGQFNVVTGIAGHGKSTFLMNVMVNQAKQLGTRWFLYTPENEQHLRDKLARIWGEEAGFKTFCERQCYVQTAPPPRYDTAAKTLPWVLDKAMVAIERDQVDVVMIDPWNELERAKPPDQMLTDYIGECLMYLKQFCRSMQVTTIIVAHPTKAGVHEGRTPGLADIEGSMNWYNKCDNGLIVARDPEKPTARVISAKAREEGAGKRGICHFWVDEAGRFTPQKGAVTP
jgi:twinkle protein